MIEINKLVNLLNRKETNKKIKKLYNKNEEMIFQEVRSFDFFRACLKAAILVDINSVHERETIDIMLKQIEDNSIFSDYMADVITIMNASCSKVGDKTGRVAKEEIDELFSFEDNIELSDLDDKEDVIIKIIKELSGFVTFDEILNGKYKKSKGYNGKPLTVGDVRNLYFVKMIPGITEYIHRKYDDQVDGDVYCLYNNVEEPIKRFAFHSKNCGACLLVIFDDDTIITFINGEYRYLPYKFSDIVYLTKLCILDYLANGAADDKEDMTLRMLADDGEYEGSSVNDLNDELFEQLTIYAYDYIRSFLDEFTYEFSELMIKDAKEEMGKYKILSSKYRL